MTRRGRELFDVASQVARASVEFPAYCIGTQRTYHGYSLVAVRRDGIQQPGVYAVIADDLVELRSALGSEPH